MTEQRRCYGCGSLKADTQFRYPDWNYCAACEDYDHYTSQIDEDEDDG